MRRDVRDVVVEDGLESIKAELTLEHLVVSRVVEDAVELLRGGDELHVAACSVRSLELAPLLLAAGRPGAGAGEGAALALRALTAAQLERMTTLACWLSRTRMSRGWRRA